MSPIKLLWKIDALNCVSVKHFVFQTGKRQNAKPKDGLPSVARTETVTCQCAGITQDTILHPELKNGSERRMVGAEGLEPPTYSV